ncbi:hypothetical protein HYC85_024283 [Camellia sinensis]|uniref:UBA domain-containing protein n=1 Tax=Camellia sinensis TaxID=4442 RepID=A0A7J7G815_CAMSI|nr:hypothetical protein HYC85_024283 [Camellia sinensis]
MSGSGMVGNHHWWERGEPRITLGERERERVAMETRCITEQGSCGMDWVKELLVLKKTSYTVVAGLQFDFKDMSPASKSKSKDKKAGKEPQKAASKSSGHANAGSGIPVSGYNPLLGKFHTLEVAPLSASPVHINNSRFRNIDESDDHCGNSIGTGTEYDTVSNNGSWSGESEDHKEKTPNHPPRQEAIPGAENDKREKTRQKNEKKHQRQKERRAQELHERCTGFLMSRKLEALAQQLVSMGFSSERATMALILNEGKIEDSVSWLFEGVEESDEHKEHNLDGGSLKIDISEELAHIADMEIRFKCLRQEVERAIVACEGDLEKAAETLRAQKQDPPSSSPKPEETDDLPTLSNGKLSVSANQNPLTVQTKPNPSSTIQQRRDEKDFNYTKAAVAIRVPVESGVKIVQAPRKVVSKSDWTKPQQIAMPAADKRGPSVASNPSVTPPPAKIETRYAMLGSELKNLQLGSVKEPVVMMQWPQSANSKPAPTSSISSSPPAAASAQETLLLMAWVRVNCTTNFITNTSNSYPMVARWIPQEQPAEMGCGTERVLLRQSQPAASLGLFSGLGSNASSGSSSPVDWNTSGSMLQLDYTNIDWTLDRSLSSSRSNGTWHGTTSVMQNNHIYDSYSGVSARTNMRPGLANGGGISLAGLQDSGAGSAEMSSAGSQEWSSPFEEKDIFSLPRQFVSEFRVSSLGFKFKVSHPEEVVSSGLSSVKIKGFDDLQSISGCKAWSS